MAPVARAASSDGRRADAALTTAPTPADRAAPPAAARLPTFAVAAAPIAAPALENLFKFNKKYIAVKQMLEQNSGKLLTRMLQPASGKTRRAAKQQRPRRRNRPNRPRMTERPGPRQSTSWPRVPANARRLRFESKKKNKILFQRNFPTHHPLIFFLRVGEGCIL